MNIRFWPTALKVETRKFFGRLFHHGISSVDLWNVDVFLAGKIARIIKRFVEMERHCVPISILEHPQDDADDYMEIWDAILWKIVDGFERIARDEDYSEYDQEAVDLFAKYYFGLWD